MMPRLLKKVFSFNYDDSIVSDSVYELHAKSWLKYLHDLHYRVRHEGSVEEGIVRAKKEHVIFILNHALTLEAPLVCQHVFSQGAGKIHMMVLREAFKIPIFREYLQLGQCVPLSVATGVQALKRRHILLFPEGLDFVKAFNNGHSVAAFHAGFLRIAKQYLKETGKESVSIIPIGHAGLEKTLKIWLIQNKFVIDSLVKPLVKTPFMIIPKLPFLFPSKVVMRWGAPQRVTLQDLGSEQKIAKKVEEFRSLIKKEILKAKIARS